MQPPVQPTLGKYQLVRKLAVGGMAEVYLAKVAGPGGFEKTLVLKRVLPHLAEDENFISMFRSEAKLAAQLNHPNVVSIFDFGQEGGVWFLVMEFIDGPNLRALFRRAFEIGQPLPFNLAAKIISSACEGLAYAHEFIDPETGEPMELVHRDISPDNILLGRNGGVKVVDFGIAKAVGQTHHTKTGTIKGKFSYMAPEQLRGQPLDRRADVFALGIVLYELVAGAKPFDTATDASIMQAILFEKFKPAAERRPDTPPELQRILDRALEKDREVRYADCREFQADLDNFIVTQGPPVGQHQLAQLVGRLSTPSGQAMATPSPKPSQPNLPRAPQPPPQQPPPPPADSTRSLVIPMDESIVSVASDTTERPTQPLMKTPAPMPVVLPEAAPPVSLGKPRASQPALPVVEPSVSFGALEGRGPLPEPPPPSGSKAGPIFGGLAVALVVAGGGIWWKLNQTPVVAVPTPAVTAPVVPDPIARPPDPVVVKAPDPVVKPPEPAVVAKAPDPAPDLVPTPVVAPVVVAAADPVKKPPTGKPPRTRKGPQTKEPVAVAAPKNDPPPVVEHPKPPEPTPVVVAKAPVEPAKVETGLVDFRVRPYASVFVNGTFYGVTPFAKVKLNVGVHSVKLVNKDIGKEITLSYEVKPGDNTLKYNLETAE